MARGRDGYVAAKMEAAYGTMPTATLQKVQFSSEGFATVIEKGSASNISANPTKVSTFETKRYSRWALNGLANYNQLNALVYGILTGVDETTPVAGEAGTSSKIFKPSITKRSIGFEVSKGNIPSSKVFLFPGCIVGSLEFKFDDNGAVSFAASGLGLTESSTAATGSNPGSGLVTPLTDLVRGRYMTVRDIGTGADGAYCLRSGSIKLEQALSSDDVCIGSTSVGEIEVDDFLNITGEFVIKFADRAAYDDYLLQTELSADIKFVSPNESVAGGTANYRSLRFKINKLKYNEPGGLVLIDKPGGPLTARIPWEAEGITGSGVNMEPMTITIEDEYTIANIQA